MRIAIGMTIATMMVLGFSSKHPITLTKKQRAEHWTLLIWLPKKIHRYPYKAKSICHRHPRRFLCRVYYKDHAWRVWAPRRLT